jgi:hypothetical protein
MAVETVRGYGRQSRHYLRTFLPAVWRHQLAARNSYGTFECCSKKLRTPHHLSFLPREVAGKVDLDAFLNALGAVGLPASCGLELWACARGQMTCAASLFGIIEERVQEPYISGTSGCPAKLSSRRLSPFSFLLKMYLRLLFFVTRSSSGSVADLWYCPESYCPDSEDILSVHRNGKCH